MKTHKENKGAQLVSRYGAAEPGRCTQFHRVAAAVDGVSIPHNEQ